MEDVTGLNLMNKKHRVDLHSILAGNLTVIQMGKQVHTLITITGLATVRFPVPSVLNALGHDVLRLLKSFLDLGAVEDQLNGLLTMLIPHPGVTPSLTHHADHVCTQLLVLLVLVGVPHRAMQRCILVQSSQRIAFKVLDIEKRVHGII
jgi:hypothetical protein